MKILNYSLSRISDNHVDATYILQNGESFTIEWSDIHAGTGERMDAYDYNPKARSDNDELEDLVKEALVEGEESELYCAILECTSPSDFTDHCTIEAIEISVYNETTNIEDSQVSVKFSTGEIFDIQLTGGEYKSSLNCLTFLDGEEYGQDDTDEHDYMEVRAIEAAEKFIAEQVTETYEERTLPFNVSFNNTSYRLRVNKDTGEAEFYAEGHYRNDYEAAIRVLKTYESEADAWKEINEHKTSEYHDFKGLNSLLNAIAEIND